MNDGNKRWVPPWVWIVVMVPLSFVLLGTLMAVAEGVYLKSRSTSDAKYAEARAVFEEWGQGLIRCGAQTGRLPPSTSPVPATFDAMASGKPYQSSAADWNEEAHRCAAFTRREPQWFQYQWDLRWVGEGVLHAVADLDANGSAETALDLTISCNGGKCSASALPGPPPNPFTVLKLLAQERTHRNSLTYYLGGLGVAVSFFWLAYVGFSVSVAWGLVVWLVPCSSFLFAAQHWERAKRPAIALWVCCVVSGLAAARNPAIADAETVTAPAARAPAPLRAPNARSTAIPLSPLPPATPPPAAAGEALDLSSIMGRAHHLANEWEPEAALLGIEASILSGRIQPSEGGSAKLTFGPSHLSAAPRHSGLFIVSYDKDGLHGSAATGKLSAELPEPMCAPEAVLLRVSEFGRAPILLRYGLDSVQRPSWLASPVSDPKQLRIFEPQACAPRGTIVVRPRL